MIKVLGVLILAVIIFLLDYRTIKNSKERRDKVVYIVTFGIALVLSVLFSLDVKLPYPLDWIKEAYEPMVEPFNNLLRESKLDH
ncbi:hypothetical protein [Salirhabdus sp. Marseille-P4669]|uniref:hypothetical protein n=1 Tax=Salirhabdus sp. Marseille-P4669 TaxID=2042310 RepID=UPI000C7ACECB|nr:hypothetical protein [Salirhabdus sp. Marseille-P4669]